MQNYKKWVFDTYKGIDSPLGEFARGVWNDRHFPRQIYCKGSMTKRRIIRYLCSNNADSLQLRVFETTWEDWRKYETD